MGSMMKGEDDRLTVQIKGDGPAGRLLVTARSDGSVKGYIQNPQADVPPKYRGKLDVGRLVGHGILNVIRDMGMKEPYTGSTSLVSGEIAEDLTYYFASSEQVNSSVGLGVLIDTDGSVRQAGGFILQLMPFASDELISRLEENLRQLPSVTSLLEDGHTPESMIRLIMKGCDVHFFDKLPAAYVCDCSMQRVEKAIISIGKKDIQEMIDDGQPIEVGCQFCRKKYKIEVSRLKELLDNAR